MSITTTDGREVRARGRRTRERLLAAGARVFAERGFHPARVDDIVATARTSHGTFYVYFPSKEALFEELVARVVAELAELVETLPDALAAAGDREELRHWLREFGRFHDRSGPVLRVWTEVGAADPQAGVGVLSELAEDLGRRLTAARPGRPRQRAAVVALAVVAMVERFHLYAASGWLQAEADEIVETLAAVVGDALER